MTDKTKTSFLIIRSIVLIAAMFLSINIFAQKIIEKYVHENTTPIATIEPDSTNYIV